MTGVFTIAKKEFTDHVTDHTFLLCFGVFFLVIIGQTFFQVHWLQLNMRNPAFGDKIWTNNLISTILIMPVAGQVSTLGALLAIALGISSISKERMEGNFKVLLSYPIYRDRVILGKLLAGVSLLSIVVILNMAASFGISIFYLSIPITLDLLLRMTIVTIMGIILLVFFLFLSTSVSALFSETSTILVILVSSIIILRREAVLLSLYVLVNLSSMIGLNIKIPSDAVYMHGSGSWQDGFLLLGSSYLRAFSCVSPIEAYKTICEKMFSFSTPLVTQLLSNWDLVAVQVLFLTITLLAAYLIFTRRDIQ